LRIEFAPFSLQDLAAVELPGAALSPTSARQHGHVCERSTIQLAATPRPSGTEWERLPHIRYFR